MRGVFGYDLLVLQTIKIWMKFVAVASIASSELRIFHAMLKERARFIITRTNGVVRNYNQMIQHANPACRAARTFPELAVGRLLLSLNDNDLPVHIWRDRHMTLTGGVGWIFQSFLYVLLSPLIVLPLVTHEFAIELTTTCILNLIMVGLVLLSRVNVFIPVGIAAFFVAGILLSCLIIWRLESRRHVAVMSSRVMDDHGMLSDEFDQPVVAEAVESPAFVALKERLLMIEAEEFTLLKDNRRKITMKNHLQAKGEMYEKLIAKYKMKHERAALAHEFDQDSGAHLPLYDFAPGEIATPFKVRPFDVSSPRDGAEAKEEAKEESVSALVLELPEQEVAAVPHV